MFLFIYFYFMFMLKSRMLQRWIWKLEATLLCEKLEELSVGFQAVLYGIKRVTNCESRNFSAVRNGRGTKVTQGCDGGG